MKVFSRLQAVTASKMFCGMMKCFQVRRRIREINFRYYGGAADCRSHPDRHPPALIAGAAPQRVRAAASVTIL
jgi:hypothetical protein